MSADQTRPDSAPARLTPSERYRFDPRSDERDLRARYDDHYRELGFSAWAEREKTEAVLDALEIPPVEVPGHIERALGPRRADELRGMAQDLLFALTTRGVTSWNVRLPARLLR